MVRVPVGGVLLRAARRRFDLGYTRVLAGNSEADRLEQVAATKHAEDEHER